MTIYIHVVLGIAQDWERARVCTHARAHRHTHTHTCVRACAYARLHAHTSSIMSEGALLVPTQAIMKMYGRNVCSIQNHWGDARLAQSVEHETLNLRVVGSSPTLGAIIKIPRLETRGIWGRKGKEDPQQVPHDARTPTTKETTKNVYLTSVGSAALPESEASNYTYTKVQRKTTEETREKTEGRGETRERMKKKREKAREEARDKRQETRERGLAGPALMTVAAATSLAAETNQRPSREVRSSTPLLRTGLHSVRGHDTEPRKTCSRVRGICNSAIMKREFVQPCAGQNSEFTMSNMTFRYAEEKKMIAHNFPIAMGLNSKTPTKRFHYCIQRETNKPCLQKPSTTEEEHSSLKRLEENIPELFSVL